MKNLTEMKEDLVKEILSTSTRLIFTIQKSIQLVPSLVRITTNETRNLHHKGLSAFLTLVTWRWIIKLNGLGFHSMMLKSLTRKVKRVEGVLQKDLIDCVDPVEVRKVGEDQLSIITEKWVQDKLNAMGMIQEETMQMMMMKIDLHEINLTSLYACSTSRGTQASD
ncbi:hypothetical protein BY996DRAFT_6484799 [Phakopsora pachyrhizi]|nr:hypothetical protein BY996DRAFT_6484799 [Phakopsora pachyrhizi]